MRYLKATVCFLLIIMLTACQKSQFMDLSGFIYNYNKTSEDEIDLTDFFFAEGSIREFKMICDNTLLTLKEAPDGKISECRVMMTKLNESGVQRNDINVSSEEFLSILKNTLMAYCHYDENSARELMNEFLLNEPDTFIKEGELTKRQGEYYFVYYSTQLVCQMMIYNTYLTEIEPTQKPKTKAPAQ